MTFEKQKLYPAPLTPKGSHGPAGSEASSHWTLGFSGLLSPHGHIGHQPSRPSASWGQGQSPTARRQLLWKKGVQRERNSPVFFKDREVGPHSSTSPGWWACEPLGAQGWGQEVCFSDESLCTGNTERRLGCLGSCVLLVGGQLCLPSWVLEVPEGPGHRAWDRGFLVEAGRGGRSGYSP